MNSQSEECEWCKAEITPVPMKTHMQRRTRCSQRSAGLTLDWRSRWGHKVTLLMFLMVLLLSPAHVDGSCRPGDFKEGYVPSDENMLNTYTPETSITTIEGCFDACCETELCDVAWLMANDCFLVQCFTEATCQPLRSPTHVDSVMVAVSYKPDITSGRACLKGFNDCTYSEVCDIDDVHGEYSCQCIVGYSRDEYGDCTRDKGSTDMHSIVTTQPQVSDLLGEYKMCKSDMDCDRDEYCFGLDVYPDGICAPESMRNDGPSLSTLEPTVVEAGPKNQSSTAPSNTDATGQVTGEPETPSYVELPEKKDGSEKPNDTEVTGGVTEGAGNNSDGNKPHSSSPIISAITTTTPPSLHERTPAAAAAAAATPLASTSSTTSNVPSTSPPSTTTSRVVIVGTPRFVQLTVSLGDSRTLQLPDETSVRLHAFVIPDVPPSDQPYSYEYEVLTKPEASNVQMTSNGQDDPQVQFSQLTAGFYQFKVAVSGSRAYGTAYVNVTVKPPPRVNQPPVAVIQPAMQVVTLPNSDTILDGSGSTDDDDNRIAIYSWEQVQGPVDAHEISGDQDTLQLTNLNPGVYLIRLTVTDFDGESNSTIANVTVKEEEDYKPHANAGPDVEIKLPVDFATLNGSKSSDDHGIVSYEWTKMVQKIADTTGSSTKLLHLTGLEEGMYQFKLTVTDVKGQHDSDIATVIVKPEMNMPPVANAGPDKELTLPSDATSLDGSGSTDDLGIETYLWEQVSGPGQAVLAKTDQVQADVSGLQEGTYVFSLTVQDTQGDSNTAQVTVTVKRERNQPPIAKAGSDQEITLPSSVLQIDGSDSTDDKGIVSYLWTRSDDSPSAGVVVGSSDHEAILRMVDLVQGLYKFTLNVSDAKGAYGTDSVTVTVKEDPNILSLVQIIFDTDIKTFSEQDKKDLIMPLAVMLGVNNGDVSIQRIAQTDTNMLKVVLIALNKTTHQPLKGPEVLRRLKSKDIMSQAALLNYNVLEYDTIVCQKNCSNHGHCDPYTKRCVCETFWMENFFRVKFQDGESNCDWSILYVIIVCFLVLAAMGIIIWLILCCCARRKKKGKRRHRYTLLEDQDNNEVMEMLPKMGNGKQSSSIMISESGEDSDDETTVFDIKRQDRNGSKPPNGYAAGKHRSTRAPHRTDEL